MAEWVCVWQTVLWRTEQASGFDRPEEEEGNTGDLDERSGMPRWVVSEGVIIRDDTALFPGVMKRGRRSRWREASSPLRRWVPKLASGRSAERRGAAGTALNPRPGLGLGPEARAFVLDLDLGAQCRTWLATARAD